MNVPQRKSLAAAFLLAAGTGLAIAGPYDQPWALFEAEGRSPTADTAAATIMKVDGRNSKPGRSDPYPPGKHSVEVSVPGPRGMSNPSRATLEIDAQPCTRYMLAARRSSPTAKDWQAFVVAEEPIGECRKKYQK